MTNKPLLALYKDKVKEIIKTTYNHQISEKWIDKYVTSIVEKAKDKQIIANCRNLYKYQRQMQISVDTILEEIYRDDLNILSNGLLTENWNPASYDIITDWMDARDVYKSVMKEAKARGDFDEFYEYNDKQNKVKSNTNSIYGASTMGTSYVSNIDMGGAITSQARNFISEQVWTIERFLGGNFTFENLNEIMCWIQMLYKIKSDIKPALYGYISYVPTADDCRHKFNMITKDVIGIRKDINKMLRSVFLMFENMGDRERILFYYANNPIELISRNKYVYELVYDLIKSDIEFINPYAIPEGLKTDIDRLTEVMRAFCYATIINGNRVIKYQTRPRKVCVVGDTDSTMPSMYSIVKDTLKIYGREDLMKDDKVQIRMTMVFVGLVTDLLGECCLNFVKCCNSYHEKERFFMYMKNEFFFPILLLFNVKKNYIGIQTIQEGKMIPREMQLAITGANLGKSGLNEYVSERIEDILENDVLRADHYDPTVVIRGVKGIQNHIEDSILNGDKSFGIYTRYNGINNLKEPEKIAVARASVIWNEMFPDDYIVPGDAVYMFDTTLRTEDDLNRIDDVEMREKIRKVVFRQNSYGLEFARFGLKAFAIPVDGDHPKLPKWIIPFIDINSVCQKHLQPITKLYSSLLLSQCKYSTEGSSVKKMGTSNLVRF